MALSAIDSIRNEELKAQQKIDAAKDSSINNLADTKVYAENIISDAQQKAKAMLDDSKASALKESDKILNDSRESALSEAESIKTIDDTLQQKVNERILDIII